MAQVCQMTLIGYVGRQPERAETTNGTPVTRFNVAINHDGPDAPPTWYVVECWRELSDTALKLVYKGALVYAQGRFRPKHYTDRNGAHRQTLVVTITDSTGIQLLSPRKEETSTE